MRNKSILVAIAILMMSGCALPRTFGPYSGKVVDAENNEPIEEAVVAVWYYTKSSSMGGTVGRFADAIETTTNANGEFSIPTHSVYLFKILEWWDDKNSVSIFKPGYAAYPGNFKAYSSLKKEQSYSIPENEYIMVYLPKLMTVKERKDNLYDIEIPGGVDILNDEIPNLRRLESEERFNVGLQPYKEWRKE
ncbi:hypothetical protein DSCA_60940 [Desulfosarcina alkanivorans]|uniref:Lipoprotein n=1 Tax=Desulfosarcina alkanivorans TaxID=571177 RepID=A0A5K7Z103_9BACT|nr:hypothetical protein [Desulfosarcina alkanivorans]BBO72164.1 hypothetical protein DSCA_60940 [Desulfosarcina alkanivorans]